MTPEQHARAKSIFVAACELDGEQRAAYLDESCAGDAELRSELERLLRHHRPAGTKVAAANGLIEYTESFGSGTPAPVASAPQAPAAPPRFQAGEMVAGRYRIVASLGAGGMGEVFRADDLRLNQTVALKFLAVDLAASAEARERLLAETRLARQITHANVCRIYDIDEADGHLFITMEYVDGESLGALLRRIGRIPSEKATDLARQIALGLASAHDKGVLHRDLKPANIMVDGNGRVRIMDFGLAAFAGRVKREERLAGTPRYMPPELLEGRDPTPQSDLYSLGLVLYEIFTGQPAFIADSALDYFRMQKFESPAKPSSLFQYLDPHVEAIILACIRKSPSQRPSSALAVAAAIPGGDVLTSALAMGHVPSPSLIADARPTFPWPRWIRFAAPVAFVVLLVLVAALGESRLGGIDATSPRPPAVLLESCRSIADSIVGRGPELDEACGFATNVDPPGGWNASIAWVDDTYMLRGGNVGAACFWYRRSATPLCPVSWVSFFFVNGRTTLSDPPAASGSLTCVVDPVGRLLRFEHVRPAAGPLNAGASEFDLPGLLSAAGIDRDSLKASEPRLLPAGYADQRHAWMGRRAAGEQVVHIDAATLGGRPTFLSVTDAGAIAPAEPAGEWHETWRRIHIVRVLRIFFLLVLFGISVPLSWHHLVRGVCDARGAVWLGLCVAALLAGEWLLVAHHTVHLDAQTYFVLASLAAITFQSLLVCLAYLALEPVVRRHWPHTLLAWSRLMGGRLRDPLIGQSIVVGTLVGLFWSLIFAVEQKSAAAFGTSPRAQITLGANLDYLLGARHVAALLLGQLRRALQHAPLILLLIVLIRVAVRRNWLAIILATLALTPLYGPLGSHTLSAGLLIGICIIGLGVCLLIRWGLAALVVAMFVANVLIAIPIRPPVAWHADTSMFVQLLTAGVFLLGLWVASRALSVAPSAGRLSGN